MGINISVLDIETMEDHPEWDSLRYGGDRYLAVFLYERPYILTNTDWREVIRPTDPRATISEFAKTYEYNQER